MSKRSTRNYSFLNSKRIAQEKMTEVNGVVIPAIPGTSYHAIISGLAEYKDKVVPWEKVFRSVERFMRQYGGQKVWADFFQKQDVESYQNRIKLNTHALTRSGKNCYGYRLHERGMCIYYFADGAMLLTGGNLVKQGAKYDVIFPDGRGLQVRYRGRSMTSSEYEKFLEMDLITSSGKILNNNGIKAYKKNCRRSLTDMQEEIEALLKPKKSNGVEVCISLCDDYDQDTADRLKGYGFVMEQVLKNQVVGTLPEENLQALIEDEDVLEVDKI